jgi:tRNA(fMet)-specific endonuclease VapC
MPTETANNHSARIRYVLDTDIVTYHQLGHKTVLNKLGQVESASVATTVITMSEQLRGRLAEVNRNQSDAQLQNSLRLLQMTHRYFCSAYVLPFETKAAQIYRSLIEQKLRIGAQDLKIAAIVLAHSAILVTANRRHFDQVPDLQIEDWTR